MTHHPFLRSLSLALAILVAAQASGYANQSSRHGCPIDYSFHSANRYNLGGLPCDGILPTTDSTCPRDPVLLTGGKLYLPVTDVAIPTAGRHNDLFLKLKRSYSSQDGYSGSFGNSWVSTLDISLFFQFQASGSILLAGSSVHVRDEDGSLLHFILGEDTPFLGQPVIFKDGQRRVEWTSAGTISAGSFVYRKPHGTRYHFEQTPAFTRLTSIEDRNGNRLAFLHDTVYPNRVTQITDGAGRSLSFLYGPNLKVSQMTDPLNRTWRYGYDPTGERLVSVTDPLSRVVRYAYVDPSDPNNITVVVDPMRYLTIYTYNTEDQVERVNKPDGSSILFTYDVLLGTSRMRDEMLKNWNYEYVRIGLGTLAVDPDAGAWRYAYDPATNLMTQKTDPLDHTTDFEYDKNENPKKIIDPLRHETLLEYEPAYNFWTLRTDANGHTTTRRIGPRGDVLEIQDARKKITVTEPDPATGQIRRITDPKSHSTHFEYDNQGDLRQVTNARKESTLFTYDRAGRLETMTDANKHLTTYTFDDGDRLRRVDFHDKTYVAMTYDDNNRLLTLRDQNTNVTTLGYEAPSSMEDPSCGSCSETRNQKPLPHTVEDAEGHVTTFTYDPHGNVRTVLDANKKLTRFTWDPFDRLKTVTDALTHVTTFDYDPVGNLKKVTDANTHEINYDYDELDRRTLERDALGHETLYGYDNTVNVLQRTDANRQVTVYTYDPTDNLESVAYPNKTQILNTYDDAGNLETRTDWTGLTAYGHDELDRLKDVTFPSKKTLSYTYDPVGNLWSVASSVSGTVSYTYDPLDRLKTALSPQGNLTTYVYDDGGRRREVLYPNGTRALYGFDRANRLLSVINERIEPHTILSSFVYTYDNVGNRLTMRDNEGLHTFDYDDVYRLEEVIHPLGTVDYTYDNVGNRLTMTVDSTVTTYRYDDANRLEQAGNRTFVHDPNGNLTSETEGASTTLYAYDPENRLISQGPSSNPTQNTYLYDGLGRRVQKNQDGLISNFYYTDFDVLFETNQADTLTVSYTHGAHIDEILSSSRNDFYLYDGLGSVQSVRDDQADPIASYTYDAFGAIRSQQGSSPNRYNFTGRELDRESGLYYYRNRYYYPQIGRFITKDPIGLDGGINYYAYVDNNPINYIDPEGLASVGIGIVFDIPAITLPNLHEIPSPPPHRNPENICPAGTYFAEHKNNKRPSSKPKHEKGKSRNKRDKGGEKGDKFRPYLGGRPNPNYVPPSEM